MNISCPNRRAGLGGIMNSGDALEFIIAGASAVAVGTASFVNPVAAIEILDGIIEYMKLHEVEDISSLTGSLNVS